MKHNNTSPTPAVACVQPVNHQPLLKIALDVHLAAHVIAVQEEGASPQPPQRFKPADFLKWVKQKVTADCRIVTCYEAGPFGYGLHRQLTALGVTNHVIRPRNWDDGHTRVKTDRTDALAMLNALDRFCAGNRKALALVRVPMQIEERRRTQTRLRQSLVRDLKMIAGRARGLALQYGFSLKGHWYGRRSWPRWQRELPAWLIQLIEPLHASALFLHDQVKQLTDTIEAASARPRPKGMGGLTEQLLDREVGDWTRFKNRRQVSSYLGLCPSENSSGQRHQQGHVTKCGNPRLRWALAELAWRLVRFQPDYRLTKKWKPRIADPHATSGRRKQALVALARGFGADWWRICTGQTTPQKLGLQMAA
ncbi:MAG: IS110 family transposase [Limisphaerales bacterium]